MKMQVKPSELKVGDVITRLDGEHEIVTVVPLTLVVNDRASITMKVRGRLHRMIVHGLQTIERSEDVRA